MKYSSLPTASAFLLGAAFVAVALPTAPAFGEGRLDFSTIDLDRYSDAPFKDDETDLAVSVLTEEQVLMGNDDGTFAANRNLNRAEFVQIVMRLLDDDGTVNKNCFPDVNPDAWYADPICRAKALGIVRGNARPGVQESLWRFEPNRDVQYEEAVKMLVQVYALPVSGDTEGADWYVPYVEAAEDMDLSIEGLNPGDQITRGEMARLTVAFLAESEGQLDELRDAEDGSMSSSSSSRTSSSSSRPISSSSRSSTSSSSVSSGSFSSDPDSNLRVRSNFLILGEVTPVLGSADFFAQTEPVDVRQLNIRFSGNPASIQQVRVYAEDDGRLLGTSLREPSGDYEILLADGALRLPHRAEMGVYVRALMKPADGGASGGQIVQIEHIEAEGDGVWSDGEYTVATTETFLPFETAPAAITVFQSTGSVTSSVFIPGGDVTLGNFEVKARSNDNDYSVEISSLTFRVAKSSEVTLSDVKLSVPGSGASSACTVSTGFITCDSIPLSVGTVDDEQLLRLTADVTLADGADDPYLQVTFQSGGSPTNPGDIVWTDGRTTYDWIGIDEPIARGIRYQ
jgi:hypothetical protein